MWKSFILWGKKYRLLPVTFKEVFWTAAKSLCMVLLLNYLFYRSVWAFIPLTFIGILYFRLEQKNLMKQKREEAREQFKEMLLLTATGQKAGYSVENAFLSAYKDMSLLYGEAGSICQMLRFLQSGRENNAALYDIWKEIGNITQIEEIQEFAQVYEIAYKSSGNMSVFMEKTADIIIQKIEVQKEIRILLSEKRLEQKIMNFMPFCIILYISFTSPGYFDQMYGTWSGIILMSLCLLVYLGAYALSVKIVSIDI